MAGDKLTNALASCDALDTKIKDMYRLQNSREKKILELMGKEDKKITLPHFDFYSIVVYLIGDEREDALTLQLAGVINKKLIDKRKWKLHFDQRQQMLFIFHENNIDYSENKKTLQAIFADDYIIDMDVTALDVESMQSKIDIYHKEERYAPGQCGLILIMPDDEQRKEIKNNLHFLSSVKYNEFPAYKKSPIRLGYTG